MSESTLTIDGLVESPINLRYSDLQNMDAADQVPDVSRFAAEKRGDAVVLEALLAMVRPLEQANYMTLHASRDDFHVSIPLAAVRGEGLLVYSLDGGPLEVKKGGPFRFLIKDFAACHTKELDDCANVKFLDRIELTQRKGQDTRPLTDEEHAALHAREHA